MQQRGLTGRSRDNEQSIPAQQAGHVFTYLQAKLQLLQEILFPHGGGPGEPFRDIRAEVWARLLYPIAVLTPDFITLDRPEDRHPGRKPFRSNHEFRMPDRRFFDQIKGGNKYLPHLRLGQRPGIVSNQNMIEAEAAKSAHWLPGCGKQRAPDFKERVRVPGHPACRIEAGRKRNDTFKRYRPMRGTHAA
ncbi:hypothetical protein D3C75_606500 [compost metagenome]